jgi:hypothetical protein
MEDKGHLKLADSRQGKVITESGIIGEGGGPRSRSPSRSPSRGGRRECDDDADSKEEKVADSGDGDGEGEGAGDRDPAAAGDAMGEDAAAKEEKPKEEQEEEGEVHEEGEEEGEAGFQRAREREAEKRAKDRADREARKTAEKTTDARITDKECPRPPLTPIYKPCKLSAISPIFDNLIAGTHLLLQHRRASSCSSRRSRACSWSSTATAHPKSRGPLTSRPSTTRCVCTRSPPLCAPAAALRGRIVEALGTS